MKHGETRWDILEEKDSRNLNQGMITIGCSVICEMHVTTENWSRKTRGKLCKLFGHFMVNWLTINEINSLLAHNSLCSFPKFRSNCCCEILLGISRYTQEHFTAKFMQSFGKHFRILGN